MERRIQWFLAVCLAVVVMVPFWRHFQAKWQLRVCKKKLEAAGEKLDIAELSPRVLPAATNTAKALRLIQVFPSFMDFYPDTMKYIGPGVARIAWREPVLMQEVANGRPEVDVWPKLRIAQQTKERQIQGLTELFNNGGLQLIFEYAQLDPNSNGNGYMAMARDSAIVLGAVTVLGLHDGRQQQAYESLRACVAAMHDCTDGPLIICQLVGYAAENITIGALWEALQSDAWSHDQWSALQSQWSDLDYLGAAIATLEMERARSQMEFDFARHSGQGLNGLLWGQSGVRTTGEIINDALLDPRKGVSDFYDSYPKYWSWKWVGSYQDEGRYLEFMQTMIDAARDAERRRSILDRLPERRDAGAIFDNLVPAPQPKGFDVCQYERPLTESWVFQSLGAQTVAQMAVAAIALKRYHMAHNSYPAGLGELVPRFVQRIPADFMDGRDLRYRLNPDGTFLLYSVGNDGVDNGGDSAPPSSRTQRPVGSFFSGRDRVWPRAATAEEVAAFNARMAAKHKGK